METKSYARKVDIVQLQNALRDFYERSGYTIATGFDPAGLSVAMQVDKNMWSMPGWLGSAVGLNIKIIPMESGVNINVFGQKYGSQATVAGVEFIVGLVGGAGTGLLCALWIGLVIPLFAAIEQKNITARTWEVIEAQMTRTAYG